jgi:hypothetical protein
MGHLITKVNSDKLNTKSSKSVNSSNLDLYKPIDEFKWKDANKKERKKHLIDAYKQLAF